MKVNEIREGDMPATADELLKQAETQLEHAVLQMVEQRDRARKFLSFTDQRILDTERQIMDLQKLRQGGQKARTIETAYRYANMDFISAFKKYLRDTDRPWSEDELVAEALNGGCYANRGERPDKKRPRGDAEVQARKSITYFLETPEDRQKRYSQALADGRKLKKKPSTKPAELRKLNGLIGLAGWPDEKFRF